MATPGPQWHDDLLVLYSERYETMVRVAYLLTADHGASEELVQDAFVAVARNWGRAERPTAYLRAAVVNNARSWLRRRALEERRSAPAPLVGDPPVDELWDALRHLPDRQRAAIVLRFYEDLPDAEIAKALGCRVPTVRTAIHRGLASLRKEVER